MNDFYRIQATLNGMPFIVKKRKEEKELRAIFFYVHHDQEILEINAKYTKFEKVKCRPATAEEFSAFFKQNKMILAEKSFKYDGIVSTHPDSITQSEEDKKKKQVTIPCIWRRDGVPILGNMQADRGILWGHSGILVMAVEKRKSLLVV